MCLLLGDQRMQIIIKLEYNVMNWLKKAVAQSESKSCWNERVTATASFTVHKRQKGFV